LHLDRVYPAYNAEDCRKNATAGSDSSLYPAKSLPSYIAIEQYPSFDLVWPAQKRRLKTAAVSLQRATPAWWQVQFPSKALTLGP
jgi:hypothetical protein